MKTLSRFFFYGYVWVLVLAGGAGIFTAKLDHRLLFGLTTTDLEPRTAASLLSQYRFLRAVECGFGAFAILFRREIFETASFNRLFLGTMLAGVIARIVSLVLDGRPAPVFWVFLVFELVGVILIFIDTRRARSNA